MQTNQAQPRSWIAGAVLCVLLVSLLAAAVQPKAQPVSAQQPDAAGQPPATTSVKDIVKHKTETHRQYALQQATPAHESVLS